MDAANEFWHQEACLDLANCNSDKCDMKMRFKLTKPFGEDRYDFEHMDEYLKTIGQCLVVVDMNNIKNFIYEGKPQNEGDHTIFIEFQRKVEDPSKGHFNFIKNMANYCDADYYCYSCRLAHYSTNHRCEGVCVYCGHSPICKGGEKVDCDSCNVTFENQTCYDNHVDNNFTETGPRCKGRKRCTECECSYKEEKKNPYVCGEYKCKDCGKKYTERPHYCMLKPLDLDKLIKEDEVNKIIVTFDIESSIDSEDGSHKPNLLISGKNVLILIKYTNHFIF